MFSYVSEMKHVTPPLPYIHFPVFQMLTVIEGLRKCQRSLSDVTAYFCVFKELDCSCKMKLHGVEGIRSI